MNDFMDVGSIVLCVVAAAMFAASSNNYAAVWAVIAGIHAYRAMALRQAVQRYRK